MNDNMFLIRLIEKTIFLNHHKLYQNILIKLIYYQNIMQQQKKLNKNYAFNSKTGLFQPINIIPSNLTKCLNCNQFIDIHDLDQHLLNNHNNYKQDNLKGSYPNYTISQKSFSTSVQKQWQLNLLQPLIDKSTSSQSASIIDVKTTLAHELPNFQERRIEKNNPVLMSRRSLKNQLVNQPIFEIEYDRRDDIKSRLSNLVMYHQDIKSPEVFWKIDFHPQKINLNQKVINLYEKKNQNEQLNNDPFRDGPKNQFNQKIQIERKFYQVEKYKSQQPSSGSKNIQKNQIIVNDFKFLSNQKQVKRISTSAKKPNLGASIDQNKNNFDTVSEYMYGDGVRQSSYGNKTQIQSSNFPFCGNLCQDPKKLQNQQTTIVIGDRRPSDYLGHSHYEGNLSCKGCGGFYCEVCKSTVPPQFRLPPKMAKLGQSRKTAITGSFETPLK